MRQQPASLGYGWAVCPDGFRGEFLKGLYTETQVLNAEKDMSGVLING